MIQLLPVYFLDFAVCLRSSNLDYPGKIQAFQAFMFDVFRRLVRQVFWSFCHEYRVEFLIFSVSRLFFLNAPPFLAKTISNYSPFFLKSTVNYLAMKSVIYTMSKKWVWQTIYLKGFYSFWKKCWFHFHVENQLYPYFYFAQMLNFLYEMSHFFIW